MIAPYISQQPVDDFGLRFTELKYSAALAMAVDTLLTIPGNAPRYKAIIEVSVTADVWVALNAVATLPAGPTFAATSSELTNGTTKLCREVKAGDVLHFLATATAEVSVVLYALNTPN